MLTLKGGYFLFAIVVFLVEVLIARFVQGGFIRNHFGDFLVVILIYCALKSVVRIPVWRAVIGVLILSYVIEVTQYFHLIRHLGLEHSPVARLILGTQFEWTDLVCYTAGMAVVYGLERARGAVPVPAPNQTEQAGAKVPAP